MAIPRHLAMVLVLAAAPAAAQPSDPPPPDTPPSDPAPEPAPVPVPEPAPPANPPPPITAPPPVVVQPPPVVEERYPRALAQRPFVLPSGAFEGGALIGVTTISSSATSTDTIELYTVIPRAKMSLGGAGELEAAATIHLGDSFEEELGVDLQTLQNVFVAARFLTTTDITIGGEVTYVNGGDLVKQYAPRFVAAGKRKTSTNSAVEVAFLLGDVHTTFDDPMLGGSATDAIVGTIQVKAQAQVTPTVAFEGRAALSLFRSLEDSMEDVDNNKTAFGQDYGARIVVSATPEVDVVAGVDLLELGANVWTFGIVARRVP